MAGPGGVMRPQSDTDTTPTWNGVGSVRRSRAVRRVLLSVFAAVLALGATGVLGVRAGQVRAAAVGWELAVTFPKVTRPGHAVPLSIEVRRAGGFGGQPVTLRLAARYFALFDQNVTMPSPSAQTATGRDLIWEFDPPPGDLLRIEVDTRTGPNRQSGERGEVAVLVDGAPVVSVGFRTRVMP